MKAFELTDEAKNDGFSGGSVVCSPLGHMFDIKEALDKGNGVIYTDSDTFAEVLRLYPALKSVDAIPEDAVPVELPHISADKAPDIGPFTPQTPVDVVAQAEALRAEAVPAEHSDAAENPDTEEDAIAAGEEVSGDATEADQEDGSGVLGRFGR